VNTDLIVGAFKGGAPTVPAANEKASVVTQKVLPQLIGNDDQFAKRLGFTDSNDVAPGGTHIVTWTMPYPVFVVDLRLLQNLPAPPNPVDPLKAGIDFIARESNWFHPTTSPLPKRYLYPIRVDDVVVSCVLLAQDETDSTQWNILQIGSSDLIKKVYQIQQPGRFFLVHVPALNRYYLGVIQAINVPPHATFTIMAIFNDPDPHIHMLSGKTSPAYTMFRLLKDKAEKIKLEDPNYPPR
jgi:hypothetical protein